MFKRTTSVYASRRFTLRHLSYVFIERIPREEQLHLGTKAQANLSCCDSSEICCSHLAVESLNRAGEFRLMSIHA